MDLEVQLSVTMHMHSYLYYVIQTYIDMKYMKQLMNITEQDSKSDITSVAASSAPGQNRKYTFEEINKDLVQIKNGLIASNLDIFADIIRTDSIAMSEDKAVTLRVQLKDALLSVEHAYESYISVLTVLMRRNYLSVLYLDTLSMKYGATYSEIVRIRIQMTMIAMALIAPTMPITPPAASSKHNPNTKDIVGGLKEDLVKVKDDQLTGNCSAESEDVTHCSKDRIRDALQNVEQAYEPNLPDLIDLLELHHISVLDELQTIKFLSTGKFVHAYTEEVIAKMSRGPQVLSEYCDASLRHGQDPMEALMGLEEDSTQVIEDQFSDELSSAKLSGRTAETKGDRGIPTSILHTKIKSFEIMKKGAVDSIESHIKKLEEVHKKELDAYSSTDGSYTDSKDQPTEIIEEAAREAKKFRAALGDIAQAYDSHLADLNLTHDESDDIFKNADIIDEELDFTNRQAILTGNEIKKTTLRIIDEIKRASLRITEVSPAASSSSMNYRNPSNIRMGLEGDSSKERKVGVSGEPSSQRHMPELGNNATSEDGIVEDRIQFAAKTTEHHADAKNLSPRSQLNSRDVLVGLKNDIVKLESRLTRKKSPLEIIPIVGMGGIGKTTLARIIYDRFSRDRSHFDICIWETISQEYNVRDILLGLLACIMRNPKTEMLNLENHQLGLRLHQNLIGRRYLIILDDIWSPKSWDDIKRFLPNDYKGSRIVLTTRETTVANYADPNESHHKMRILDEVDGWRLLKEKVYSKDACPPELEMVGKRIARNCGELPLAIEVIGGILSEAERSESFWGQFASNMSFYMGTADEQLQGVFSCSYAYLPHYLKPCFLYMGSFPEDHKIRTSTLIKLWVAEGFLKPIQSKTIEDAKMYLTNLVERNLVFIREKKSNGEVKSYDIHDLLRSLCLVRAKEKKLFNVVRNLPEDTSSLRCVSAHSSHCWDIDALGSEVRPMSLARSLLCNCSATEWNCHPFMGFQLSLLRVLDVFQVYFPEFPKEILQLVNLRYLALYCQSGILDRIFIFRNLQTFIFQFNRGSYFQARIFDLPQLRHFKFRGPIMIDKYRVCRRSGLLENLLSLSNIPSDLLNLVLGAAPNLKKLGIKVTLKCNADCITTLTCFRKLEILLIGGMLCSSRPYDLDKLIFPPSLRKLTLSGCKLSSSCLRKMGELANLEVLKLQFVKFEDNTWEPSEGEFSELKFLLLEQVDLVGWLAEESCFPVLQKLVIQSCFKLNGIPSDIGEIPTLEKIDVINCNFSVDISAKIIQKEQLAYGNYDLKVHVL